jgi:serine/threonine protein kinase
LPTPVVHRDIKPKNIFLKGQSFVLGDFGLIKLLNGHDEADHNIFKESVGFGMPYFYRTPDLIAYGKRESGITTKSDVFQLGLVAIELFTGRNPVTNVFSTQYMLRGGTGF